MKLHKLIDGLPIVLARGSAHAEITDVVEDSRDVTAGCVFIARPGAQDDGRKYVADAVARAAVAVLTDDASIVPPATAAIIADDVARAGAKLAEKFHGNPSSALKLIGITGT